MIKRKFRFNPIDFLILVVIAAAVVILVSVFDSNADPAADQTLKTANIEYVIEIKDVDDSIRRSLAAGQKVEDAVNRKDIGILKAFSETTTEAAGFDFENNREIYSDAEGRINLTLTVTAQAVETDSAFTVDGCEIRVGKQMSVILPEFQGYGYCISLNKLS